MKYLIPLLLIATLSTSAQTKDYSKDVTSIDATIAALYEVISGDPGVPRDWDRFRNLFQQEARLIPTRKNPQGELILQALKPDEYVQLFSTYETKEKKDGPVTNRGINSIQLFFDGKRYSIVNVFWCAESLGFPLPEKYVK